MTELPIKNIIEAAIFTADEPMSLIKIGHLFSEHKRPDNDELKKVLEELVADYSDRVVELVKVASGYRFQARTDYAPWLQRLVERKPPRYSRALLETLALVAYKQPITRGEIEGVRGVAVSSNIVKTLIERNWVKQVGYREVPGRPALLATTKQFLDYFNLNKLTDLPELSELMNLDELGQQLGMQLTLDESAENSGNCASEDADVEQEAIVAESPMVETSDQDNEGSESSQSQAVVESSVSSAQSASEDAVADEDVGAAEQGDTVAESSMVEASNQGNEGNECSQSHVEVESPVSLRQAEISEDEVAVKDEVEETPSNPIQQTESESVVANDELYPEDQLPSVEQAENGSVSSEQASMAEQPNEAEVVETVEV
jgi:segregation and condensation protein B